MIKKKKFWEQNLIYVNSAKKLNSQIFKMKFLFVYSWSNQFFIRKFLDFFLKQGNFENFQNFWKKIN